MDADSYRQLQLPWALDQPQHYVEACLELALLISNGFSSFDKSVQSLIVCDTLKAFSEVKKFQFLSARRAAEKLKQAAEGSFPKQKRTAALGEFKRCIVQSRREGRKFKEDDAPGVESDESDEMVELLKGPSALPPEVLSRIFSFLDAPSLARSAAVCSSWRAEACSSSLWKEHCMVLFPSLCTRKDAHGQSKINARRGLQGRTSSVALEAEERLLDWRTEFQSAARGSSGTVLRSGRLLCPGCQRVVWIGRDNPCVSKRCSIQGMQPKSATEVVHRVLGQEGRDSDSESEDESLHFRLWSTSKVLQ